MADIITDLFDETKEYVRTIFQRGRDLVGDELNESFDIERILRRRTLTNIFGDGFITTGFQTTPSTNADEIIIQTGNCLIQGEHINNPSDFPISGLNTPSGADRTDIVYLRVRETEIDSTADPTIEFPDIGETTRRIKLTWDVIIDEGSVVLPTTTGDLHDAGIHYELIGFINRLDGVALIDLTQLSDARRIIGFSFLNEDKNLEVIGGGEVSFTEAAGVGTITFGVGAAGAGDVTDPDNIWIIQPSTAGNAYISHTGGSNPFGMTTATIAYVTLDREAPTDYEVFIQIVPFGNVPDNANSFALAFMGLDNKLYFKDGTCWDNGQTHAMRINPFTGLIVDVDVAPAADIQGTKLLIASVPLDRLVSLPPGVPQGGIILWDESVSIGCPPTYTKLELGTNDTYVRIAGVGGSANITPTGSNSHGHGSHTHTAGGGPGNYKITLPLFDVFDVVFAFGAPGNFDAFQSGVGFGTRLQDFFVTGISGSTTISSGNHEPKHVQLLLCRKD